MCDPEIGVAAKLKGWCLMIGTTITLIALGYFINKCMAGQMSKATCKI
jgi:hypothetical protein